MKVPPQSGVVWPARVAVLLAVVGVVCGASAQEQSSQRQRNEPATEVSSARLEDKYPQIEVRRALPEPPSVRYSALQKSAPARIVLPRLDTQPYIEEDEREIRNGERRIRGGVVREVKISSAKDGEWIEVEPGTKVWRLEIQSPGARGIRLHLANVSLGSGSQLFIYEGEKPDSTNVYSKASIDKNGDIFSWPTTSDNLRIELVSSDAQSQDSFEILGVGHFYRGTSDPSTIVPAGTCNLDASCYPDWEHSADAVGRIDYISGSSIYYCSGALINNNSGDFSPLFLTAAHCGIDSSTDVWAHILWKYKTNSCNGQEMFGPSSNGTKFLASSAGSDSTLLAITGFVPTGLSWAGWSIAAPGIGSAVTGIHHPETSYRRISFGNTLSDDSGFKQYHQVRFGSGTTEPGSSGSPLFNDKHEIIGQLWGGTASCSNPGGSAYYGKLALSYPNLKDANGSNYLENGLGDDRFGDISSRARAATPSSTSGSSAREEDLIMRPGHDDWFRISVPPYAYLSVAVWGSTIPGEATLELYRGNDEVPFSTFTGGGNSSEFRSDAQTRNGPTQTDYFIRVFLKSGVRVGYTFANTLIPSAPPPTATTNMQPTGTFPHISVSGIVNPNGVTVSAGMSYGPAETANAYSIGFASTQLSGSGAQVVSGEVPNLEAGTLYSYRVWATNGSDYAFGEFGTIATPGPIALLSDRFVILPNILLGTSRSGSVQLTNRGDQPLLVSGITSDGNIGESSDCGPVIAPGAYCRVAYSFNANALYNQGGRIIVSHNGKTGSSVIVISGYVFDVQMAFNRPGRPNRGASNPVITTGQTATIPVTMSAVGGSTGVASLGCSGAPAGVSCQVQPAVVNLGGGPADVNVVVSVDKSAGQQGRAMRLRGRASQQKSFELTVNATVGNAVRRLQIPVTVTQ